MAIINLESYGPIISDKNVGDEIFNLINSELAKGNKVEIDLGAIRSMATFCSKQIFGKLYKQIGAEKFFSEITLKNASNDLKTIIKLGIKKAIEDN